MRLIDVVWHHDLPDEPVRLISEIDSAGLETRKIEVYVDGHADYADASQSTGGTILGDQPVPPNDEIAADPDFSVREISGDEFEVLWGRALAANRID